MAEERETQNKDTCDERHKGIDSSIGDIKARLWRIEAEIFAAVGAYYVTTHTGAIKIASAWVAAHFV